MVMVSFPQFSRAKPRGADGRAEREEKDEIIMEAEHLNSILKAEHLNSFLKT